jgi:hypothetical protein
MRILFIEDAAWKLAEKVGHNSPQFAYNYGEDTIFPADFEWLDARPMPFTFDELKIEASRAQAEHEAQQFARDRVPEYPEIGDQLDALFHAGVFPAEMAAQIQAVKDKYPKA